MTATSPFTAAAAPSCPRPSRAATPWSPGRATRSGIGIGSDVRRWHVAALAFALAVAVPANAQAPACADTPGFHALDFWIGDWQVFVDTVEVGRNRITPILGGCAVREEWTATGGGRGESLFYYLPATDQWKQVWVTDRATARGGVKEKTLIERLDGGAVRFQGSIPVAGGGTYLDRTTLTPLADGRIRQLIEISTDGGRTWRATFDAVYARLRR